VAGQLMLAGTAGSIPDSRVPSVEEVTTQVPSALIASPRTSWPVSSRLQVPVAAFQISPCRRERRSPRESRPR